LGLLHSDIEFVVNSVIGGHFVDTVNGLDRVLLILVENLLNTVVHTRLDVAITVDLGARKLDVSAERAAYFDVTSFVAVSTQGVRLGLNVEGNSERHGYLHFVNVTQCQ